jgi:hypothetical protein
LPSTQNPTKFFCCPKKGPFVTVCRTLFCRACTINLLSVAANNPSTFTLVQYLLEKGLGKPECNFKGKLLALLSNIRLGQKGPLKVLECRPPVLDAIEQDWREEPTRVTIK